ncbi:MAG: hypothetical protein GEV08_19630 [Acidimicrobiia bacterium]|nr:hypothetical protein [Acidimicrobiia bacterium]
MVDALIELGSVCIAVDKGSSWGSRAAQRLHEQAEGVWQRRIPGLETMGSRDARGAPSLIHPRGGLPGERDLGPVRLVGWAKRPDGRSGPLLHAKLLVLCVAWTWENDGGGWDDLLTPLWVWSGSANWTEAAKGHVELGMWSKDERLAEEALRFLADVLRISEPWSQPSGVPAPEMVEAAWDDDAFVEHLAEMLEVDEDEP